MRSAESSSCPPAPPPSTSTAPIGSATTSSPTRLLALDANTGKRIWHFQAVKHDIWDRDFPSPPALVSVKRDGKTVDAVAQTTKSGHVFVFERTNGKPLFPIEYRKYPASDVPGEVAAKTQPLPVEAGAVRAAGR